MEDVSSCGKYRVAKEATSALVPGVEETKVKYVYSGVEITVSNPD